ncbi:hypothetical protein V7S43_015783 [Phytophthora oleae]|uniref:Uncharacterized protein n=1 Tax=Phytophthora oleae TaxID=2107226 RepID=A0ABD3EXE3_9STRA
MKPASSGFNKGAACPCGNDPEHLVICQPTADSPFGSAFTCVEDVDQGFFHKIHKCKAIEGELSLESLKKEKDKVAGPGDIFVFYCSGEVKGDISSLENCAVVDSTCWEEYYGPFAARARFASKRRPCHS